MKKDATGAAAQAGLGHEARALADRLGHGLAFLAAPPAPTTPVAATPTPEPTR